MYVAEDRRLDEVIAAFNAYHDGWIVLRGGAVQGLRVNAVLDLRTPDASLDALASGLPIRVRHVSRYLTVITGA
jgi:transmembrane sensor